MSEWPMVPLGQVAQAVDCEHKTAPAAGLGDEYGFPVGTPNLRNGRIDYGTANTVCKADFRGWSRRARTRRRRLDLAREAPVGQVALVDPSIPTCLGRRTVLVRPGQGRIVDPFLHGYLSRRDAQEWIGGSHQAGPPSLT